MCFSLNRSFSKYTSYSEFVTPLEFVLFFRKDPPYAPLNAATTVQGALQQNSKYRVQAPMIRCCKLFKIIKLGLTAFLTVLSEHKKREKSVKYPCRPLARYIENTDEQKFITFLKVSICRHLGNYSVYVQLTQRVWISSENPLYGLNASFIQSVTLSDKMVWQEG